MTLTSELVPAKPAVAPAPTIQQIVDEHDRNVQLNFSPYAQRIVNSWLRTEDKFRSLPNYLDGQTDVKSYMRETLIDWIVEMNSHFRHRRETLYLCVNIIDRYVAATIREKKDMVSRTNYQLVGVSAYLIASKYEEIYYPEIRMILQFADNVYSEDDVKKMELKIVNMLKYDLTIPTTNKFLGRFLRVGSRESAWCVVNIEQRRALHVLFHLRSDAAEHQHVGVEAFCAGRGCDLSGPEVLRVYGQLGEREKRESDA